MYHLNDPTHGWDIGGVYVQYTQGVQRRWEFFLTVIWSNLEVPAMINGDVKTIMKKLEKLGAIKCIQKGKSACFTRRANLYRREV